MSSKQIYAGSNPAIGTKFLPPYLNWIESKFPKLVVVRSIRTGGTKFFLFGGDMKVRFILFTFLLLFSFCSSRKYFYVSSLDDVGDHISFFGSYENLKDTVEEGKGFKIFYK